MKYVKVYKENGELDEELTMIENARIDTQFRFIEILDKYLEGIKDEENN